MYNLEQQREDKIQLINRFDSFIDRQELDYNRSLAGLKISTLEIVELQNKHEAYISQLRQIQETKRIDLQNIESLLK